MLSLLVAAAALAGRVELTDGSGCLTEEALEPAVAPVVAELPVTVAVEVLPEGDDHAVGVRVLRRDALVWSREVTVAAPDCPDLPDLVALTVRQGLATLPELQGLPPPWTVRWGGSLVGSLGTGPSAPGVSAGLRLLVERRLGLLAELRGGTTTPWTVGSGRARIGEGLIAAGPAARVGALRGAVLLEAGVGLAEGSGFARDERRLLPRLSGSAVGAWALGGPWTVELRVTAPLARATLIGDDAAREPAARLGLGVGLLLPGEVE